MREQDVKVAHYVSDTECEGNLIKMVHIPTGLKAEKVGSTGLSLRREVWSDLQRKVEGPDLGMALMDYGLVPL